MNDINKKRMKYFKEQYGNGRLLDKYESAKFLEVVTNRGGDVCTFRVYGNNHSNFIITER